MLEWLIYFSESVHWIPISDQWKLELRYTTSDVERLKIHCERFCFLSMWFSFSCLHNGFWLITSLHGWWLQLSHAKQLNCLATYTAAGRKRNCMRESSVRVDAKEEARKSKWERHRERWHVYYYMGIHLLGLCGCERHVRTKCGVIN